MTPDAPLDTPITQWADALESAAMYAPYLGVTPPTVRVYQQTKSTQDIARQQSGRWSVVLANEQTAGRGRLGRAWVAPPGSGVLMSLAWPGLADRGTLDAIAYRVAVAVAQTAEHFLGPDAGRVRIKWPNDILVDGKKLAGILIERHDTAAIIGIGFNVALDQSQLAGLPKDVAKRITSLSILRHPADRLRVAADLIARCHVNLSSSDTRGLLDAWRSRSPLGYEARFKSQGQRIVGTVIDLDPAFGLIVRRDTGELIHLPAATTSVIQ